MKGYKAKHKLRNWLVIIFFVIIIIIWINWQKNVWQKNIKENPTNSSVIINNKEINNNLKNIKNKLKESYQKWQEAKEQFSQELNSQASSTDEINPEILEKIKNKLINQTSTEILEN